MTSRTGAVPSERFDHDDAVRVLVVDDEGPERARLRAHLAGRPEIGVVAECAGGDGSIEVVRRLRPDLVFLTIRMPHARELEIVAGVMESLDPGEHPFVVFVTDHERFATDAFEIDAVDYVVRPYTPERLDRALDRALERLRQSERVELLEHVRDALFDVESLDGGASGRYASRLSLRTAEGVTIVPVEDIDWIESDDVYARIHTAGRSHLTRAALRDLEHRLDPRRFVRIHRSTIVNVDRVRKVVRDDRGAERVVLKGGERLRVSRGRRDSLYDVLEIVE